MMVMGIDVRLDHTLNNGVVRFRDGRHPDYFIPLLTHGDPLTIDLFRSLRVRYLHANGSDPDILFCSSDRFRQLHESLMPPVVSDTADLSTRINPRFYKTVNSDGYRIEASVKVPETMLSVSYETINLSLSEESMRRRLRRELFQKIKTWATEEFERNKREDPGCLGFNNSGSEVGGLYSVTATEAIRRMAPGSIFQYGTSSFRPHWDEISQHINPAPSSSSRSDLASQPETSPAMDQPLLALDELTHIRQPGSIQTGEDRESSHPGSVQRSLADDPLVLQAPRERE